jgi:protein TonB
VTRPWGPQLPLARRPAIVEVVLAAPGAQRWRHLPIALLVALAAHGSLWLWAQKSGRSPVSARPRVASAPLELARDAYLEPARPPAPEERTSAARLPRPPALARTRVAARARPAPASPPPPAQAGAIIAQEPSPSAPLDLTSATFVVGAASTYAGGVTASRGSNTAAGGAGDVDARAAPGASSAGPDRSSNVSLAQQSWSCPWPHEADTERIDEQTVVIRVIVAPDGTVQATEVISDPGHGFGPAAVACALRTRFTPARDRAGEPLRARSPPIRVRFTR